MMATFSGRAVFLGTAAVAIVPVSMAVSAVASQTAVMADMISSGRI